jgi:hypothetical protein
MDEYRKYRNIVKNIHVPEELKQDLLLQAESRKKAENSGSIAEYQTGIKAEGRAEGLPTEVKITDRAEGLSTGAKTTNRAEGYSTGAKTADRTEEHPAGTKAKNEAERHLARTKAADEKTENQLAGQNAQDRRESKRIKFAGNRRKMQRVTKGVAAAACVCALLTGVLAYQNLLPGTTASMTGNVGADQQAGAAAVSSGKANADQQAGTAAPDGNSDKEVSGKVDNRNRFYLAGPEGETGDAAASSMQGEDGIVADPSEEQRTEENTEGETGTSEGENAEEYPDSFTQAGQSGSDMVKRIALTPVDTYAGTQYFPGCEFLVGGDNIRSVSLQIDRGGLYTVAAETMTDLEAREKCKELTQNADYIAENYKTTDYEIDETNASEDDSVVTFYTKTYVGQTLTLEGGEEMQERVGFYLPDEAFSDEDEAVDLRQATHKSLDYLNGAVLSLEVTFSDGTEENYSYRLDTGKIKYSYEGGEGHTLPEFLSDEEAQDQPYLYGILMTDVTVQ